MTRLEELDYRRRMSLCMLIGSVVLAMVHVSSAVYSLQSTVNAGVFNLCFISTMITYFSVMIWCFRRQTLKINTLSRGLESDDIYHSLNQSEEIGIHIGIQFRAGLLISSIAGILINVLDLAYPAHNQKSLSVIVYLTISQYFVCGIIAFPSQHSLLKHRRNLAEKLLLHIKQKVANHRCFIDLMKCSETPEFKKEPPMTYIELLYFHTTVMASVYGVCCVCNNQIFKERGCRLLVCDHRYHESCFFKHAIVSDSCKKCHSKLRNSISKVLITL